MENSYFRAGAGSIIYNTEGNILIFKRAAHPVGIWQLQQGGIDGTETPEDALWRELKEEVGLSRDDFSNVTSYPEWTLYEFGEGIKKSPSNQFPERLGQCHRWWFMELKNTVEIDLTRATDDEFSEYRWTTFEELISETNELKRHVYQELANYFTKYITKQ